VKHFIQASSTHPHKEERKEEGTRSQMLPGIWVGCIYVGYFHIFSFTSFGADSAKACVALSQVPIHVGYPMNLYRVIVTVTVTVTDPGLHDFHINPTSPKLLFLFSNQLICSFFFRGIKLIPTNRL
jgi:hypothetical protein